MFKLLSLRKNKTDIICKRDGKEAKSLRKNKTDIICKRDGKEAKSLAE